MLESRLPVKRVGSQANLHAISLPVADGPETIMEVTTEKLNLIVN